MTHAQHYGAMIALALAIAVQSQDPADAAASVGASGFQKNIACVSAYANQLELSGEPASDIATAVTAECSTISDLWRNQVIRIVVERRACRKTKGCVWTGNLPNWGGASTNFPETSQHKRP